MRPIARHHPAVAASAATLIALALLTSGCGKSSTAPRVDPVVEPPSPPPASQYTDVTVNFETVYVLHDGDDALAGAGDCWFAAYVSDRNSGSNRNTGDVTNPLNWVKLNDGDSFPWNYTTTFRIKNDDPGTINFTVIAAEMDLNPFNENFADPDLSFVRQDVVVPHDARQFNIGLIKVRLGNSNCQVEFRVRITSKPVPVS